MDQQEEQHRQTDGNDLFDNIEPHLHPFDAHRVSVHTSAETGQETPDPPPEHTSATPVIIMTPVEDEQAPTPTVSVDMNPMDPSDIDMEAASIYSNQSYDTAPDYEEASLFEKDNGSSDQGCSIEDSSVNIDSNSDSNHLNNDSGIPSPLDSEHSAGARTHSFVTQHSTKLHNQDQDQQRDAEQAANRRLITIEPAALLKQQLTILHPALTATPDPSTVLPTVFALASSVPNPTVHQISMTTPGLPTATDLVPVPFKTVLHPPLNPAGAANASRTEEATSRPLSSESITSPDFPRAEDLDDNIHPYFAGSNLLEQRPSSRDRNAAHEKAELIEPSGPEAGWSKLGPDQGSSTLSTSFFTPLSDSARAPVSHTIYSQHLDPTHDRQKVDDFQRPQEEALAATEENNSIGSRTTVFGFTPINNPGNQQANMLSSEEGVLRDGHVCQKLPIDHRARSSDGVGGDGAIGGGGSRGYGSNLNELLSGGMLNPMSTPRVRAGISPTLNLEQHEDATGVPQAEDEESVKDLMDTKDWSKTGLGPRSSWPTELLTFVSLLMRSASPLAIYWGDQHYLLYNDAWRPILKRKHPLALGAPGSTVWSEIWDVLAAQIAEVKRTGHGTDNKGLRMDLRREGYEEECYFDFTFSPILLQDGSIGGIFAVVQEVTQSILNQRRLMTLNQFSKQAPLIQSIRGAHSMITTILQESNNLDIPFSIVYKMKETAKNPATSHAYGTFSPQPSSQHSSYIDNTSITPPEHEVLLRAGPLAGTGMGSDQDTSSAARSKVRLIRSHFSAGLPPDKKNGRRIPQTAILCSTSFDRNLETVSYGGVKEKVFSKTTSSRHIPDSLLITPEEYEPLDPSEPVHDDPWAWPVRSVLSDGIPRLVTLPKATHRLARALLLPILENPSVLESRISTILIVGINPFQMLDNQYLDFLALLVANIASLLHFGRSREEERMSNEALFELNKAKISFFQNVSHELRTPLTLMLAPLDDVLNQTPENAPTRQNLEMVRRNCRRMLKLINTLLQFSRIEAGKGQAQFEETDLAKATREISANFESVARGFGLEYIIKCEDLSGVSGGIWVDRAMWGGVILNLIGNAFKHTWEGSVTVHQYPSKGKNGRDGVAVDVTDTGVGIASEHLHTLFGRFNRIESEQSRSHEGTGIGLSLVKELTEVHGGSVSVTSELGKGTCFRLWIPAGRAHHPCAQVKLGDSKDNSLLRPPKNEALNNKTDASMYVEEAQQWIAHKALPGSTLTASGTDSTEEDKDEDDDDALHLGINYMQREATGEMNAYYEVSAMNLDENELTKILIDPPESGDVVVPEIPLSKIDPHIPPRRTSSTVHSPKVPMIDILGLPSRGWEPPHVPQTGEVIERSVNDDGGYREEAVTDNLAEEREEAKKSMPSVRSRRGYIIIVDDNNDMRSYLREILGKDFRVRCAVDGLDAIRLISERLHQGKRIDLVLSDVAMPNMNGYDLLKWLRNDPATMMTPFILLSARAGEEANVEGLDLGADDCLVKPFSARELLARVRSTIRLSDLRHELIREQRHALEMKQLIYSISVRIRSGLSLPQILDTASRELFKVIRCNAIRICRFRGVDQETGEHWVRFVSEIVQVGNPKVLTPTDRLLPKGLEVEESLVANNDHESSGELRHITNHQHPVFGAKNFISVALIYNRKVWGYLLASREADMKDWSQSEKLLFEQTGNQISLAIAHANLWELKKSQQVEMEAAHAASEAKSQILANTSHELRTPIGAIVGALSALEDTDYNLTGEQRDMVKIMQITSDVALSVINDLLDTAKLEAGAMRLNIKDCPNIVETLEQSVRIFADKAGRKELDMIMEPSEDLDNLVILLEQGNSVWTDGDRLQQVIMNLIGNAVKFTAAGKVCIKFTLHKSDAPLLGGDSTADVQQQQQQQQQQEVQQSPDARVRLQIPPDATMTQVTFRFEVSDTGIGIDSEFLKNHIFKSFAQYDQTMTRRFGGTGLGLAISKHLVMMNGGILGVTSTVGQGSTFYFTWPAFIVTSPSVPTVPKSPFRPRLSPEVAFATRVVVVEPLADARQVLCKFLNQLNVQVTPYESYEGVVQDEQGRQPDLLRPDGSALTASYRPNVHFFLTTRMNTADSVVETARALAVLYNQRNDLVRTNGNADYKVSIVLVIFSSPQSRYLAKDTIKRICADGFEDMVRCHYIVKPVMTDRIVECLQMVESHEAFTQDVSEESPNTTQAGTIQSGYQQLYRRHSKHSQRALPNEHDSDHNAESTDRQILPANSSVSPVSSDYERDIDYNSNTLEASSLNPDRRASSPDHMSVAAPKTNVDLTSPASASRPVTAASNTPGHQRVSSATQRRLRMKMNSDSSANRAGAAVKPIAGTQSTDESAQSSSENPAFSNRAARAAAGKRERKGKCILCVEDNIINLRLQKLGYDTQSACDGQVAIDIIKSQVEMLGEGTTALLSAQDRQPQTGGMDGVGIALCFAGESDKQHLSSSPASFHMSIGNGFLLIPESNGNMSHIFDQTELLTSTLIPGSARMASISTTNVLAPLSDAISASSSSIPALGDATTITTTTTTTTATEATISLAPAILDGVDESATGQHPIAVATATSPNPSKTGALEGLLSSSSSTSLRNHSKIDLILMDCAMPIKSGFEAASEIRAMGQSSTFAANIPIIALTASAVPSTKEKCIASGMNGYLSKPTKLANLEAMLDQWIE
ncbi:hypothetical protein BGZ54_008994 [Gamsiella multidivaricata]|nr:hypothetical protein BGZ54_008994 [Gamsiella multidivaricata]